MSFPLGAIATYIEDTDTLRLYTSVHTELHTAIMKEHNIRDVENPDISRLQIYHIRFAPACLFHAHNLNKKTLTMADSFPESWHIQYLPFQFSCKPTQSLKYLQQGGQPLPHVDTEIRRKLCNLVTEKGYFIKNPPNYMQRLCHCRSWMFVEKHHQCIKQYILEGVGYLVSEAKQSLGTVGSTQAINRICPQDPELRATKHPLGFCFGMTENCGDTHQIIGKGCIGYAYGHATQVICDGGIGYAYSPHVIQETRGNGRAVNYTIAKPKQKELS